MSLTEPSHITVAVARPSRAQAAIFAIASVLSIAAAVGLMLGLDVSWRQAAFLPLLVSGLLLIAWNTHWALCFTAFAIAPFGVVQWELLGATVNLPEALILALATKEGYYFLARHEGLSPIFPLRTTALFLFAAAAAIVTGVLHQNGTLRVLQDCRQFTEFLVLFWLVIHRVSGREEALRITFCYVIGVTLLAIHGIVQQVEPVGIMATQVSSDLHLYRGVRSTSFYGATALGGIMVLAITPAVGVVLSSKRHVTRLIMTLCIFLCAVAIVYTRTRASWIGLAVAMALIAISIRPTPRLIASGLGAAALLGLLLGPLVVQRLYTLTDPQEDASIMARVQYYAAAARIGQANPLFGLGWGPFYEINTLLGIEPYVVPVFSESLAAEGVAGEPEEEATVHSAYLQLLVKTGLLGVVAFAAIITVWLTRIWAARFIRFQGDSAHGLFVGITAGLAGYLLHCTFENFFQWPVMAQSFWLLFGLSFVLAPRSDVRAPHYRVPLAFMGCVAVGFVIFMAICVRLEKSHPNHYQRNIALALEAGDRAKALEIARRATVARWNEPMPHTVYARLLLQNGEPNAALAELAKSVDASEKPRTSRRRNTGLYYYFAPARLTWGQYLATQGAQDQALQQFELARVHADLHDPQFAEFHSVLYATYAARNRWGRALEFGRPEADTLNALAGESLVQLGEAAVARGDWDLATEVSGSLIAKGEALPSAHCFLGRAALARGDAAGAVAPLQQATEGGADAGYFLGEALTQLGRTTEALSAYSSVPPGDVHRPLALARAWTISSAPERAPLIQEFRQAIAGMEPVPGEDVASSRLLAFSIDRTRLASDTALSVLLLWGRGSTDLAGLNGLTFSASGDGNTVALEGTDLLLQLRRHENRLDWASVEQVRPEDTVLPGWIDSARDWFYLREEPSAPIYTDDSRAGALRLERLAWYFSVPARVTEGKGHLIAGRILDRDGGGRLSWQFINAGNQVVQSGYLSDGEPVADWSPVSAYVPPIVEGRHAVRVTVDLLRPIGHAAFDDLLLLELEPPEANAESDTP